MPYISQEARNEIINQNRQPDTVGELTYSISVLLEEYRLHKGESFQTFAECLIAAEQAADEFRRVVVHPYESWKLREHGAVHASLVAAALSPAPVVMPGLIT